jgi:alpha/beta superfamily hydrolase
LEVKNISISGGGQGNLAAYLFMPESDCRYVLIVCHGFRGAKENSGRIFSFAPRVNKLGLGVLAFDFSGSGASDGDFANMSLSSQVSDLRRAIDYIDSNYNQQVILLGRSFGGSTVLAAAGDDNEKVAGCIFWSTPVKLYETFTDIVEAFTCLKAGEKLEIKDEFDSFSLKSSFVEDFARHNMEKYLQKIAPYPVLVIHGAADEVVDPANALYIYENTQHTELHIISGADHRFTGHIEEREDLTLNWLKRTLLIRK